MLISTEFSQHSFNGFSGGHVGHCWAQLPTLLIMKLFLEVARTQQKILVRHTGLNEQEMYINETQRA
jgi:hypothetical protein